MQLQGDHQTPGDTPHFDGPAFDRNPDFDRAMLDELRPAINQRSVWATGFDPVGPLVDEDDVRFLIVHHTASRNDYGPDDVAAEIQGFHRLHTGPERGWSDVAYNFVIDRHGGIWEGRAGSLERAVQGDATGGSQGFSQLCGLIGNHHDVPPTAEAQAALVSLFAWLSHRHRITTAPGSTVDFFSRGSDLWAAGTPVTARTISGHRDMSDTVCPGDLAYGLLDGTLPEAVSRRREEAYRTVAPAFVDLDDTSGSAATSDPIPELESAEVTDADQQATDNGATLRSEEVALDDGGLSVDTLTDRLGEETELVAWPVGASAAAGALAAVIALRRRRVTGRSSDRPPMTRPPG